MTDDKPAPYVRFGNYIEGFVLQELASELGNGATWSIDGNLYRNKTRPWQMATLDGAIRKIDRETRTR